MKKNAFCLTDIAILKFIYIAAALVLVSMHISGCAAAVLLVGGHEADPPDQVVADVISGDQDGSSNAPANKPLKASSSQKIYTQRAEKKKASEYWCWGLGVMVKTHQKTTVTKFADAGYSSAKKCLRLGDEILKVGETDIDSGNAEAILTKPLSSDDDGMVPVLIRREGKELRYRIKPNVF